MATYCGRDVKFWHDRRVKMEAEEGWLDDHAQEVCNEALAAMVNSQHHRNMHKAVKGAVDRGCRTSSAFLKACTNALAKTLKRGTDGLTARTATALLWWSVTVLKYLDQETGKTAIGLVVQGMDQLLNRVWTLTEGRKGPWKAARGAVANLLWTRPAMATEFQDALSKVFLPFVTSALVDHELRIGTLSRDLKDKVLNAYNAHVVGTSKHVQPGVVQCFDAFIPQINQQEFSELVLPSIVRMCKRSQETVMPAFFSFCEWTRLDLSDHVEQILPAILLQIRHKDEDQRKLGIAVLCSLVAKVHDVEVLASTMSVLTSLLGGKCKEGKVKNWVERLSISDAIGAVATAKSCLEADTQITNNTTEFLAQFLKDEMHEEVLRHCYESLGQWMYVAKQPFTDTVVGALARGLKEQRMAVRRQALSCIVHSLIGEKRFTIDKTIEEKAMSLSGTALAPTIEELVGQALSKPNQLRSEGIAGCLLLAICQGSGSALGVPVEVANQDSGLLSEASLQRLSLSDLNTLVHLAGWLLTIGFDDFAEQSIRLVSLLSLYPDYSVSRNALSVAQHFAGKGSFRLGFLHRLWEWSTQAQPLHPQAIQEEEQSSGTNGKLLLQSVLAIISGHAATDKQKLCVDELSMAVVLVHLPVVQHHHARSWHILWKILSASLPDSISPAPYIRDVASSLIPAISILTCLEVGKSPLNTVGGLALGSLLNVCEDGIWPSLSVLLERLLNTTEHDALSSREVDIWRAHSSVLAESNSRGTFGDQLVGPTSGKKGLDPLRPSIRDARAEKGIKVGNKQGKKDPRELAMQAQREEEEKIKHRIDGIRDSLAAGLAVTSLIARSAPLPTFAHLDFFAEFVYPLLSSPVVGDVALDCMRRLCSRVRPSLLANASFDTSLALRETCLHPVCKGDPSSTGEVAKSIAIMATCFRDSGQLPSQTYCLLFPILRYTLSSPVYSSLHESALLVLSSHTSAGLVIPRSQAVLLCYHVLQMMPTLTDKLLVVLTALCEGIEEGELDSALEGLLSEHARVRAAAIRALEYVPCLSGKFVQRSHHLACRLWLAMHDVDEKNAEMAERLWDLYPYGLGSEYGSELIKYIQHKNLSIREAAADAIAAAIHEHPSTISATFLSLFAIYPSAEDILEGSEWEPRNGLALAIKASAEEFSSSDLPLMFNFLISKGLADPEERVRTDMVAAGVEIIDQVGADHSNMLVPLFESYLNNKKVDDMHEEQYDLVREGVVVFLGRVAKHLPTSDAKAREILQRLLKALHTPSESVQRAVSECLPGLIPAIQSDTHETEKVVAEMLQQLLNGNAYGTRRGAAFGLAGLVKGLGVASLKQYSIMDTLKEASEAKKEPQKREGALFAFECMCDKLGRMFEPYVIHILPIMLTCFSDSSVPVREATDLAARAVMRNLSAQGVKLVMPSLLNGLDDPAWRTQVGSVQMLGAMAFCAPKQLSSCLPTVVPKLSEVLGSSHPKVQAAAKTALQQIGSVIQNPEVQQLVPAIILAFDSPAKHNATCLDTILGTVFMNTVDAPSLALLIPVVNRGIRDRSTETKKKAAKIIGQMSSLVNEPKDLTPYVPLILPELQKIVVDPNPDIRAIAAKSLGSLMRGLGEEKFTELVPWLLETMKSETSAVERSGAAQGLSEILAIMEPQKVDQLLPTLLEAARSQSSAAREGCVVLCRFLPSTLGDGFVRHLPTALPVVIGGLADDNEGVREAAFSTTRVFIDLYARTSFPVLLPAVEEGMFNSNWRIRQSSVDLLGEFLFKVSGLSSKLLMNEGIAGPRTTSEAEAAKIQQVVGEDRMWGVLARLYLSRSDPALTVRTAALSVWKSLVPNTPRTLVDILGPLIELSIELLANGDEDSTMMAGRCLGELVRKLGDRILPKVVPILQQSMTSPVVSTRCGVCAGLTEILEATTKSQLAVYLPELLPTVELALCDSEDSVRNAGGKAFGVLVKSGGRVAIDAIVPALINQLHDTEGDDRTLEGLKQVLSVCPQLLTDILPKLVHMPMDAFRAESLGALAEVAWADLQRHLGTVVPPLIETAAMGGDSDASKASQDALHSIGTVVEGKAVDSMIRELQMKMDVGEESACACRVIEHVFKSSSRVEWEQHAPALVAMLVPLLGDSLADCVTAAWAALNSIVAGFPKEKTGVLVRPLKNSLALVGERVYKESDGLSVELPGLNLPKGLSPFLTVFLQGILQTGSLELREQSAEGLGQVIAMTSQSAIKPFVVQIAGPLIRTMSDRSASQVKSAILKALGILIDSSGQGLKPFVPQLQTTFVKCLQDGSSEIRDRAAKNLGPLMKLSTRVDPLVGDLCQQLKSSESTGVKLAVVRALCSIFDCAGKGVSPNVLTAAGEAIATTLTETENDTIREAAAACIGAFLSHCSEQELDHFLRGGLVSGVARGSISWQERLGFALGLAASLRRAPDRMCGPSADLERIKSIVKGLCFALGDELVSVREAAAHGSHRLLCYLIGHHTSIVSSTLSSLLPGLAALLAGSETEGKVAGCICFRKVAEAECAAGVDFLSAHFSSFVPPLLLLMDGKGDVKSSSEYAIRAVMRLSKGDVSYATGHVQLMDRSTRSTLTEGTLRRLARKHGEMEEEVFEW